MQLFISAVNGRRLSCSRNDSEELYRLRSFADHMSQIKDLFRLQSGLDIRSFQKNEGLYSIEFSLLIRSVTLFFSSASSSHASLYPSLRSNLLLCKCF